MPSANTIAKSLEYFLNLALYFPVLIALVCGNVEFFEDIYWEINFTLPANFFYLHPKRCDKTIKPAMNYGNFLII
jgi:hypothetical protein